MLMMKRRTSDDISNQRYSSGWPQQIVKTSGERYRRKPWKEIEVTRNILEEGEQRKICLQRTSALHRRLKFVLLRLMF